MICSYCGVAEAGKHGVYCDECWKNKPNFLPEERYVAALKRFQKFIEEGGELRYYDDETPGCKNTECTWGLCDQRPEMWPDKMDHTWPHSFETEDRVAPLSLNVGNPCPMDKRGVKSEIFGCFYHCRVFQGPKPTRGQAMELYQLALERLRG